MHYTRCVTDAGIIVQGAGHVVSVYPGAYLGLRITGFRNELL